MKKLLSVMMAVGLIVLSGVTAGGVRAAATQSPTTENQTTVVAATIGTGSAASNITAEIECLSAQLVQSSPDMTAEEKAVFDDVVDTLSKAEDVAILSLRDINIKSNDPAAEEALEKQIKESGLTITLAISGLKSGVEYTCYHCASTCDPKDMSTWEKCPCIVDMVKGTCTFTVYSLSPIAIVSAETGSAPGTGSDSTQNTSLLIWSIVAGVAVCGIISLSAYTVISRKKKNK